MKKNEPQVKTVVEFAVGLPNGLFLIEGNKLPTGPDDPGADRRVRNSAPRSGQDRLLQPGPGPDRGSAREQVLPRREDGDDFDYRVRSGHRVVRQSSPGWRSHG